MKRIVVIDIEATCWAPGDPRRALQSKISELIEIYALPLSANEHSVDESHFHMLVKPKDITKLSEFCVQLTGITQAQVDHAVSRGSFISAWEKWLDQYTQNEERSKEGRPTHIRQDNLVKVASWGTFDQKLLKRAWESHRTAEPPWRHLDIKSLFERFCKSQRSESTDWYHESGLRRISGLSLKEAVDAIKFQRPGPAHSAHADTLAAEACLNFIMDEKRVTPRERLVLNLVDDADSRYKALNLSRPALYWGEAAQKYLGSKSELAKLATQLVERRILTRDQETGGWFRTAQ